MLLPALTIVVLLIALAIVVVLCLFQNYLIPSPYQSFLAYTRRGSSHLSHTLVTLEESLWVSYGGVVWNMVRCWIL